MINLVLGSLPKPFHWLLYLFKPRWWVAVLLYLRPFFWNRFFNRRLKKDKDREVYKPPEYYANLVTLLDDHDFKQLTLVEQMQKLINKGFINAKMSQNNAIDFFWCHAALAEKHTDLCYLVSVHFNLYAGSVLRLGTERHQKHLISADQGDVGCFGLTEKAYGVLSGLFVGTTLEHDPDKKEYIIHTPEPRFAKNWITNGGHYATKMVLFAKEGDHVRALLIPLRPEAGADCYPGISCEKILDRSMLKQVDNGVFTFDHYRVPDTCLLDAPMDPNRNHFQQLANQLLSGRLCIASAGLHIGRDLLQKSVAYMKQRSNQDDGTTIYDHAAIRSKFEAQTAVGVVMQDLLTWTQHYFSASTSRTERDLVEAICATKAFNTLWLQRVALLSQNHCGAFGLTQQMGSVLNNAQAHILVEGDSYVMLQKVAKDTLKSWQKSGVMGYLKKAVAIVRAPYLRRFFLMREFVLVMALAYRLPKDNVIEAWIKKHEELVYALAWARVDNIILSKYEKKGDRFEELFCCQRIVENLPDFTRFTNFDKNDLKFVVGKLQES
jgi:alkylation response protein AidB-like acyl-CoA dehydrogenase